MPRHGTEVWIDIDRTTHSLDTIVELIDANGDVLARSDNSPAELASGAVPAVPVSSGNPTGTNAARLMQRDTFNGNDLFTTNPRDAGMRVVLPGAPGLRNEYFIRVRSKGTTLDDREGLTRGAYQLQLRLREADEVPGSAIRNSDIRFATNGIEVLGLPEPFAPVGRRRGNDGQQRHAGQCPGNWQPADDGARQPGGRRQPRAPRATSTSSR